MLRISWSTIFVCTNFQIRIYWHPSLEFTNLSQLKWMYLCINQEYLTNVNGNIPAQRTVLPPLPPAKPQHPELPHVVVLAIPQGRHWVSIHIYWNKLDSHLCQAQWTLNDFKLLSCEVWCLPWSVMYSLSNSVKTTPDHYCPEFIWKLTSPWSTPWGPPCSPIWCPPWSLPWSCNLLWLHLSHTNPS